MTEQEFDVVVLGGGTAGYTAAIRASQLGLRVALVEEDRVGGVCLHRGCIPTKALLEVAETVAQARRAAAFGVEVGEPSLDLPAVHRYRQQVVEELYRGLRGVIAKRRIEVVQGRGRLLSPVEVAVEGAAPRRLRGRRIVLATGSRPAELPGLPCDGERILTSDHVLELAELPRHLIVVGGGAVGLEFASFFLDVGVPVTIVELLPRLLPQMDEELGRGLERALGARGATVLTAARLVPEGCRLDGDDVELLVEREGETRRLRGSHVLVAIGRRANVEGLGLEEAGVALAGGFVRVEATMQTTAPGVYAAGDVAGGPLLAHKAAAEGAIAAEALAGKAPQPLDYGRVPAVVYTRPQAAAVGLTEEAAREQGRRVRGQRFSLRYNAMATIRRETEGFAKVIYDLDSGEVLGVHVLAPQAGELVAEAALARHLGASAWHLATSIHPHPSLSEVIGESAQMAARLSIYL